MNIKHDLAMDDTSATIAAQTADTPLVSTTTQAADSSTPPETIFASSDYDLDAVDDDDESVAPDEDITDSDRQTSRAETRAAAPRSDAPWVSERHSPADIMLPAGVNPFPEPDSIALQILGLGVTQELSMLIAALHPIVAIPNRKRVEAIANYQYLPIHRLAGNPIEIAVIRNRKFARQVTTESVGILLTLLTARNTSERLAIALDLRRPEIWSALFSGAYNVHHQAALLGVSTKTLKVAIANQETEREQQQATSTKREEDE